MIVLLVGEAWDHPELRARLTIHPVVDDKLTGIVRDYYYCPFGDWGCTTLEVYEET